jgi:hypothetical protein
VPGQVAQDLPSKRWFRDPVEGCYASLDCRKLYKY